MVAVFDLIPEERAILSQNEAPCKAIAGSRTVRQSSIGSGSERNQMVLILEEIWKDPNRAHRSKKKSIAPQFRI